MSNAINIISNCAKGDGVSGPRKVFENTCKGLELIKQPYVINQNIADYQWNWVHDSLEALVEIAVKGKPAVLGPNIVVLPQDLPRLRPQLKNCIYLQPSAPIVGLWEYLNFFESKLLPWPVGIDIDSFKVDKRNIKKNQVMVYYKERAPRLLFETLEIIWKQNLIPKVLFYGEYTEEQYLQTLCECEFGVWLGKPESQGIALQEALAAGLPLIVIDAKSLFDTYARKEYLFPQELKSFVVTSAPYFDRRCGIIIDSTKDLKSAIEKLKNCFDSLDPNGFIRETLSLEISAKNLVSIFSQLNICGKTKTNKKLSHKEFSLSLITKVIIRINKLKIINYLLKRISSINKKF
jgi:glycosyltransferase involved in cell wall biosynthesis